VALKSFLGTPAEIFDKAYLARNRFRRRRDGLTMDAVYRFSLFSKTMEIT